MADERRVNGFTDVLQDEADLTIYITQQRYVLNTNIIYIISELKY